MSKPANDLLRAIPSVDALLNDDRVRSHAGDAPHALLAEAIRTALDGLRRAWSADTPDTAPHAVPEIAAQAAVDAVRRAVVPHYRHVINATGIVLHTGLGRAVLAPRALKQVADELGGYSVLQIGLADGKRAKRDERIEKLLTTLTGAEAATVVNNNAAATMLVLNTVAAGGEVIVARGQLVEIGGSFRLPDVMEASGAKLVEVGSTNKVHPRDYERAITDDTAAILRVHPSNYKIVGFSAETPLAEMERIAHAHGLALIDDVGAGSLVDFSQFGFEREPTLPESVVAGADLITASADKLIGAGQGGIILGKSSFLERVRKNPMARAVRVDKVTLAILEATLTCFLDEALALDEIPTLRMLRRSRASLVRQAGRVAKALRAEAGDAAQVEVIDGFSQMGSGSLPGQDLPTCLVAIAPAAGADDLTARLRLGNPPVFARIQQGRVLLDPRTVLPGEEKALVRAVCAAITKGAENA